MNPVISAQATVLQDLLTKSQAMKASMFMDQTHLPYDVQDLIMAALNSLERLDADVIEQVLESYCAESSFDERMLH